MTDTFAKFARLRELYPEDIKNIEAEEERVTELLKRKEHDALRRRRVSLHRAQFWRWLPMCSARLASDPKMRTLSSSSERSWKP